jgi:hypothetical protein
MIHLVTSDNWSKGRGSSGEVYAHSKAVAKELQQLQQVNTPTGPAELQQLLLLAPPGHLYTSQRQLQELKKTNVWLWQHD